MILFPYVPSFPYVKWLFEFIVSFIKSFTNLKVKLSFRLKPSEVWHICWKTRGFRELCFLALNEPRKH